MTKTILEVFYEHKDRMTTRHLKELDIYEEHFRKFIGQEVNVLEVGIGGGGMLQVWKKYFGEKARIFGIDKEARLKFEESQIEIFTGFQEDRNFLRKVIEKVKYLDIIIDDGGHAPTEQIPTFEELFPYLREGGVYVCEDLHIAYHPNFINNNIMDFFKSKIDRITVKLERDYSIHFYPLTCIIKKDQKSFVEPCSSPMTVGMVHPNDD